MSVDYIQVLRSISGSRKTQYLISILHDTAYFPYFFLVNQVYFLKRNPSTRSYASSYVFLHRAVFNRVSVESSLCLLWFCFAL